MDDSPRRRARRRPFATRPAAAALLALITAALLAFVAALPDSAGAATPPRTGYAAFRVLLFDDDTVRRSNGAIAGRLSLCQQRDGALDGFLLPDDSQADLTIDGSRDGDAVTIRTGFDLRGLDLAGTLKDGKITGAGTMGFHHYTFVATPEALAPAGDDALPACS